MASAAAGSRLAELYDSRRRALDERVMFPSPGVKTLMAAAHEQALREEPPQIWSCPWPGADTERVARQAADAHLTQTLRAMSAAGWFEPSASLGARDLHVDTYEMLPGLAVEVGAVCANRGACVWPLDRDCAGCIRPPA